jgi:ribosomal protein L19
MRIDGRTTEEIIHVLKNVYKVTVEELINIISWIERELDRAYEEVAEEDI